MIPIHSPQTEEERHYNKKHKSTRSKVERCIGALKLQFRCLFKENKLRYSPKRANKIILSCVVLHNFLISRNFDVLADITSELEANNPGPDNNRQRNTGGGEYLRRGRAIRQELAQSLFVNHHIPPPAQPPNPPQQ